MSRTLKIIGTFVAAVGCFGVACLLILIMAAVPYLVADLYGDATMILIGLIAIGLAFAALAFLGFWLRKKGVKMAEDEWRANWSN